MRNLRNRATAIAIATSRVFDHPRRRKRSRPSPDGRRAATIELGREAAITQQVREARAGASIDAVLQDVRYGARMLRANPGFTLVVVLSLAAGIGANSAIFSVANAMLLQTLPVPEPEQLHVVRFQSRAAGHAARSRIRSSSSCATGFPTPDGLAAMSRVVAHAPAPVRRRAAEPPACSWSPASSSACCGCAAARTPAHARRQSHPRRASRRRDQRRVLAPPLQRAPPTRSAATSPSTASHFTIVGVAPPGFTGVVARIAGRRVDPGDDAGRRQLRAELQRRELPTS